MSCMHWRVFSLHVLLLVGISSYALADEACDENALGLESSDSTITRLFYTGTCHYRNRAYGDAVTYWQQIPLLDPANADEQALSLHSLNNLGYLLFFGLGVEEDKSTALEYWQTATEQGHDEAVYHLCHAYADVDQPTYDSYQAKPYCQKAKRIYLDKQREDDVILEAIDGYLKQLNRHSNIRAK